MKLLKIFLKISVAILLFIFFTFLTLLAILLQPYRLLVWILAKCIDTDNVGFAQGLSTFILGASAEKPWLNILTHVVIDGDISAETIRSTFEDRILHSKGYDNLRRYSTKFMGFTLIKNMKDFNLRKHIRPYDYGEDMFLTSPFNEEDLRRASAGIIAADWKRRQSPWELLVARNFQYHKNDSLKTVLVFKFDHGLMEGFSLLKMLYKLFDAEDALVMTGASPRRSFWERIFFPLKIFYDLGDQFVDAFTWPKTWVLGKNPELQFYSALMESIPMEAIKKIRNKYNVCYSAVLLAGISGGIFRIMREAGQETPRCMTCCTALRMNNHPGGLTNHFECSRFALKICSPNPEVVQKLSQDFKKTTTSFSTVGLRYLTYLGSVMPHLISRIIVYPDSGQTTIGVANVPVSSGLYTLSGFPVTDFLCFIANNSGVFPPGFNVAMGGFGRKQRISATIDKSLFPSEEKFKKLGEYIREEILNML